MNKTKIEWVKNPDGTQGYTCNVFTGCLKRCSYCYAWKESRGRCRQADMRGIAIDDSYPDDPFWPRFHEYRLEKILKTKKPCGIFLNNRSDGFGDYWLQPWLDKVWTVIRTCYWHRFYLLTKQPQNLIKFSPFPDNCWVGVTATDRRMFVEALRGLKDIRAEVKYISTEPCLERVISNDGWIFEGAENVPIDDAFMMKLTGINWLIIGAQTKPYKPPKIEWAEEIVGAADKAGIPMFLKDNLKPLIASVGFSIKEYLVDEWGNDMKPAKLRQEMPNGSHGTD